MASAASSIREVDFMRTTSKIPNNLYQKRQYYLKTLNNTVIKPKTYKLELVNNMPRTCGDLHLCSLDELPLYRHRDDENTRYQSFKDNHWPTYLEKYAAPMARWGFFYTGIAVDVTCFHCGVTIGDWRGDLVDEHDYTVESKVQHAIHSVQCPMVQSLYQDKTFHHHFLEWDIKHNHSYFKTFLEDTGASGDVIESYYTQRERIRARSAGGLIAGGSGAGSIDTQKIAQTLRREITFLRSQVHHKTEYYDRCIVCTINVKDVVVLPCGHISTCRECLLRIVAEATDVTNVKCSCCNTSILAFTKAFYVTHDVEV